MKRTLCFIGFLLCLNALQAAVSFATQPYLQSLTPNSVTIMWVVSGSSSVTGWVEYGISSCDTEAFEIDHGLKQAFVKIYRVHIDDLTPGQTYRYKAKVREITGFTGNTALNWGNTIESETYTFTTPTDDATSVQCLVFNDLHSNHDYMQSIMQTNNLSFNNQDFVFLNGDILNAVPNEAEIINHMLAPYAAQFASHIPFFFTRGNHEYRNKYARNLINYIDMPLSDEDRLLHNYNFFYSFSWGPCFFIVLDTGEDKEDSHSEYYGLLDCEAYRRSQVEFLQQQLESPEYQQAKFRVVFMHIPMWSNTSIARYAVEDCRNLFLPLLNQYQPDVVICGHTHKAGILEADAQHSFPIVIGGGKDITEEKMTYCPSVIQIDATNNSFNLNILDYYGSNKGALHLNK